MILTKRNKAEFIDFLLDMAIEVRGDAEDAFGFSYKFAVKLLNRGGDRIVKGTDFYKNHVAAYFDGGEKLNFSAFIVQLFIFYYEADRSWKREFTRFVDHFSEGHVKIAPSALADAVEAADAEFFDDDEFPY